MPSKIQALTLLLAALVAAAAAAGLPDQRATRLSSAAATAATRQPITVERPTTTSKLVTTNAPSHELDPQFGSCPQGKEWVYFAGSCYKLYNEQQYWYPAEQQCQSVGGHLVSINSRLENAFVGKLTYCESAWTGGYALDIRKLTDTSNYDWTDGSSRRYNAHNFSSIQHIHKPLLKSCNLQLINNVYHAKNEFVCEVPARNMSQSCECDSGWRFVDGNCYIMPNRVSAMFEAMYYCGARGAGVVSIHNKDELRAMSLLDLESYECPVETWVGLTKLIPCDSDYRSVNACFRWQDYSGDFKGFPEWATPPEITKDKSICVYLKDRKLQTLECHHKRRFICKKRATSKTRSC